jgi:transcriptional regulator with XRE-family HTH domain
MLDEQAVKANCCNDRRINAVDEFIGSRLKSQRLNHGLSQDDLAMMLGTTAQQVQRYEHGMDRISASRLFAISKILDVSVRCFFEDLQ